MHAVLTWCILILSAYAFNLYIKRGITMKVWIFALLICVAAISSHGQSEDAYREDGETSSAGLLDPSRLSINHSLSFGMGGSQVSNLKSQSMYTTMIQYQFNTPLTLNLNLGLPIHSTFSASQNLTGDNIQNLDYFKNIPIDASLSWQPHENFMMRFSVMRRPDGFGSGMLYDSFRGLPYHVDNFHNNRRK